ncbi:hypothetical protein IE4803_PB00047 (plasmid) [Rhizobium etli bv. phaseoli str. IE4803]|nr:hypothetical protein IE4803_PB00047 [Rhizobium etli bv. phaseoli str. IE4803]
MIATDGDRQLQRERRQWPSRSPASVDWGDRAGRLPAAMVFTFLASSAIYHFSS